MKNLQTNSQTFLAVCPSRAFLSQPSESLIISSAGERSCNTTLPSSISSRQAGPIELNNTESYEGVSFMFNFLDIRNKAKRIITNCQQSHQTIFFAPLPLLQYQKSCCTVTAVMCQSIDQTLDRWSSQTNNITEKIFKLFDFIPADDITRCGRWGIS